MFERVIDPIRSHPTVAGVITPLWGAVLSWVNRLFEILPDVLVNANAIITLIVGLIALRIQILKLRQQKRKDGNVPE